MAEEKKVSTAPAKPVTAVKKDDTKPGFFKRIGKWFREMKSELKKVIWPTPKTLRNNVFISVGMMLASAFDDRGLVNGYHAGSGAAQAGRLTGMAEEAKWYVVHTYSGYENAVAAAVMKAAENRKMTDLIKEVNIPMETVTEITDSGEKNVERKVFPGYVLVKMILTDDSWHLIHNVRGATGFVGSDGKAIPLTEQEIFDLGVERREIVVGYGLGDQVKVIDGPLAGFFGVVDELEPEKDRVRVIVSMFGRETPVDLELDQVEVQKD